MMDAPYVAYLSLLDELRRALATLTELAQKKTDAVRNDDLAALDLVLKQEQVLSLTLRGLEQKKTAQLAQLGLTDLPLLQLYTAYPQELQLQAKETAEELKRQFTLYQGAAEVSRNTLECNLHEIEKVLADMGGTESGIGYTPPGAELPHAMKTDFRA